MTAPPQARAPEGPSDPTNRGSSLAQLAVRGGSYLIGREAIGMVIRLVGVVVVVRVIGPAPYGLYSGATAFVVLVASVAQLGLEVYLIRIPGPIEARHYNQAFTLLLVASILVTAAAEGLTYAFAGLLRPVGVLLPLRVLLLSIPINVLWAPSQAAIERQFGYRLMGLIELGGDVALYGTAIPLAFLGAKEWALVVGYFAWQVWLFAASLSTSWLRLRWDWSMAAVRDMTRHGLTFSSALWVDRLGELVNPLVVGTFLGAAGVGYVAFAQRLVDTLAFAKRGAYRLGLVAMARVGNDETTRLRYSLEEGSLLQLLGLAIPFACFGIVARWVVPLVFGHQWAPAIPLYSLLALFTVLGTAAFVQTTFLYSRGRNLSVMVVSIVHSVILAGASVVLVRHLGLKGYGIAWLATLVSIVVSDRVVRGMFSFSYSKVIRWSLVLGPAILFPILPMPLALFLLIPLLFLILPQMSSELTRIYRLVRSSISRPATGATDAPMEGPRP
ncbi:MAG: oligosaccharide flippase family protein [Acidimicrobiales bacterium]